IKMMDRGSELAREIMHQLSGATTARVTIPSLMNSGSLGNEVINSVEREYFLKNMGGHLRIEPLLAVRIAQEFLPHLRRSDLQKSLYRAINLQVGFDSSF